MIEEHSKYKICDVHREGEGEKKVHQKISQTIFNVLSLSAHITQRESRRKQKEEIECGGQKNYFFEGFFAITV